MRFDIEQERIRQLTLEFLEGKRVIPMKVTNFPNQPEDGDAQKNKEIEDLLKMSKEFFGKV